MRFEILSPTHENAPSNVIDGKLNRTNPMFLDAMMVHSASFVICAPDAIKGNQVMLSEIIKQNADISEGPRLIPDYNTVITSDVYRDPRTGDQHIVVTLYNLDFDFLGGTDLDQSEILGKPCVVTVMNNTGFRQFMIDIVSKTPIFRIRADQETF